jgi:hypothetical protein
MVSIVSLWLPILLSAIGVFILSSIFHILLRYHSSDFSEVPEEEKVMDDLRKYSIPPGEYSMPRAKDMKDMSSPEFVEKMKKGPVMMLTVMKNEPAKLGPSLAIWFLYSIVVGIFAAYVAGRALGPDAHYLAVFRFTGVTAFLGYTMALWQETIWYNRKISTSIKNSIDGLIYALFTAGIFGWLWP